MFPGCFKKNTHQKQKKQFRQTVGGKNRAPLAAPDASNPRAPRLTLKGYNAAEEKEVEWT